MVALNQVFRVTRHFNSVLGVAVKHKLILIVMFAFLTVLYSCNGKEAGASYVNKIGELPKGATISDFWFSGPGMDHCYLWKIDFENADNKTKYITNLKDYESCVDGLGKDTGLGDARFPNWFKRDIIKKPRRH